MTETETETETNPIPTKSEQIVGVKLISPTPNKHQIWVDRLVECTSYVKPTPEDPIVKRINTYTFRDMVFESEDMKEAIKEASRLLETVRRASPTVKHQ
jgi:hypothetical protein